MYIYIHTYTYIYLSLRRVYTYMNTCIYVYAQAYTYSSNTIAHLVDIVIVNLPIFLTTLCVIGILAALEDFGDFKACARR